MKYYAEKFDEKGKLVESIEFSTEQKAASTVNAVGAALSVVSSVMSQVQRAQKQKQLHKFLINGKAVYAINLKSAIKKSRKK